MTILQQFLMRIKLAPLIAPLIVDTVIEVVLRGAAYFAVITGLLNICDCNEDPLTISLIVCKALCFLHMALFHTG